MPQRFVRIAALVASLAAVLVPRAAEAATVSGYVRDKSSGESLPYVQVFFEDLRTGAITSLAGYYAIPNVPPGNHVLRVAFLGYQDYTKEITVNGGVMVHNIELAEEAIEVAAVQVEAERVTAPSLTIAPSRTTLRMPDFRTAPALAEPDPIRVVQTLPGVLSLSDFSVGLYVRGSTPDQNLLLLDGVSLYNVSHLFGLFSAFPADAVKSSELLKGGFPAQYGGRLSSVLTINTDEGNKRTMVGKGGVSLISSRLTMEGPFAKGSWLVSGRRTYLEPILKLASRWNDTFGNLGYNFYDVQGKTHQVFSHEHQLSIAGYAGDDNLRFSDQTFDSQLLWGNRSLSATWSYVPVDRLFFRTTGAIARYRSRLQLGIEDFGVVERNRLFDWTVKSDATVFLTEHNTVETGFEFICHTMNYTADFDKQTYNSFSIRTHHASAYAQTTLRPWAFLSVQPGVRANYFDNGGYVDIDPRFSARYQIGENTYLKGAVGRYSQYLFRVAREFQGINFLSDLWFTADSTAEPSHAWQYVAGLETKLTPDIDLTLEGYYKDFEMLAEFNSDAQTPMSAGQMLRRGDGEAYGLEFGLQKRAGRHKGWISYTLGWTTRTIEGINVDNYGNPQPYYPKFDQRHAANFVYGFDVTPRWTLNARYAFASGQGYTPVIGRYSISDPIFVSEQLYRDRLNSRRLPYYSRLDVGLRGKFRRWGVTWMPFMEVINVTNRKNIFNRYWDDGNPDTTPPEPGKEKNFPQLPFLVTLGVDLEF